MLGLVHAWEEEQARNYPLAGAGGRHPPSSRRTSLPLPSSALNDPDHEEQQPPPIEPSASLSAGFNHDVAGRPSLRPCSSSWGTAVLLLVYRCTKCQSVTTADIDGWFRVGCPHFPVSSPSMTNRKGPRTSAEKENWERECHHRLCALPQPPIFRTRDAKSLERRGSWPRPSTVFFEQRPVNVDTGVADDVSVQCALYNATLVSIITAHGSSVKIWNALTGKLKRAFFAVTQNRATSQQCASTIDMKVYYR